MRITKLKDCYTDDKDAHMVLPYFDQNKQVNTWRIKLIKQPKGCWQDIYLSIFDDQTINIQKLYNDGYEKVGDKENQTSLYGIYPKEVTFNMGSYSKNSKCQFGDTVEFTYFTSNGLLRIKSQQNRFSALEKMIPKEKVYRPALYSFYKDTQFEIEADYFMK